MFKIIEMRELGILIANKRNLNTFEMTKSAYIKISFALSSARSQLWVFLRLGHYWYEFLSCSDTC